MTLGPLGHPSQHVLSSAASGPTASTLAGLSCMKPVLASLRLMFLTQPHGTVGHSSKARKAGWSTGWATPGSYLGASLSFEVPAQTGSSATLD